MGATSSGTNKKSLIKLFMLIEYFHTQSLQNTIHIYLKSTKPNHCIFLYFMKPCMICLYKKNETDSAQELWNDMHTLEKACLSLKKIGRKQFLQQKQPHVIRGREAKCIQGLKNQICTTENFEAYCQLDLPSTQI